MAMSPHAPSSSERRRAPRFPIRLAVTIGGLRLHTTNVSASGTQLICPQLQLASLESRITGASLKLSLEPADTAAIMVVADVVYISEIGAEFAIGLHFQHFADDGKDRYEDWLIHISEGKEAR